MGKGRAMLLLFMGMVFLGCRSSGLHEERGTSFPPATLTRDEQVQVLLLRRQLDDPALEEYVTGTGRPVYVAVGANFFSHGREAKDPSDTVMAALGQHPYPMKKFSEYLEMVGGHARWWRERVTIYWVGPLKWIDENTVETSTGRYLGPKAANGQELRLHWKDGHWEIEWLGGGWIS